MRFRLKTLIDITETGARKGEDPLQYKQQQNFLIALQTISMRANPIANRSPTVENLDSLGGLSFGNKYKGPNRVWTLDFEFESENQHSLEMLLEDFNLVPVISQLTETVKLDNSVFITKDSKSKNIVFEVVG
jgi:hypothetical protein